MTDAKNGVMSEVFDAMQRPDRESAQRATDTAASYNHALREAAASIPCQTCRAELEACTGQVGDLIANLQTRQLIASARIIAHTANGHRG